MTDTTVLELNASQAVSAQAAALPMARLADRLATLVPPQAAAELAKPLPLPSPAVQAALEKSRRKAAKAARRAMRPRSRWFVGRVVDSFVSACAFIPYAVVGLALRLVMARLFFFDGQTRIEGPRVPLVFRDFDFSFVLPAQPKIDTFNAFMTKYATVPVTPAIGAYLLSYAEFVLPVMLVVGLGTRFAAFGLLVMTAVIQIYVMPEALWTTHIYWASVLMVLLSLGAGQVSLDHLIRFIARR